MIKERVFGLDLLRALAVMMVLLAHASFSFLPLQWNFEVEGMIGQLGVELFFVLSGFLIGGILANEASQPHFDLRRFWARRWLRTLPNYYLFLAINFLIERYATGNWPHVASYVVFLQNLAWPQPIFFIESWSLSIEEIFYLVAPLLVLPLRHRAARFGGPLVLIILGIAAATALRIGYVLWVDPGWDLSLRMVAGARLDAIAYGVVAMWLCRRDGGLSPGVARNVAVAGVVGLAIAMAMYLNLPRDTNFFARTFWFSLTSASFAAFLPMASQWVRSGLPGVVEASVLAIARWSYAVYLCQLAVVRTIALAAPKPSTFFGCLTLALSVIVISIVCAATVYRFYERPFLRLRDRLM